ncbi:YadA-like family protein [Mesorhizobium ciceri]|uniref:YadA-like family protein n=1 Tax=Mesorhizobium ciceri TaxID=39645 RepID=UPI003084638A
MRLPGYWQADQRKPHGSPWRYGASPGDGGTGYDDRPEKLSIAGGFGHFKGQSGLALGLGYNTSEDFRLNAAVSATTSRGDVGVSVGASWTLN